LHEASVGASATTGNSVELLELTFAECENTLAGLQCHPFRRGPRSTFGVGGAASGVGLNVR
jgi:hypothetical protein